MNAFDNDLKYTLHRCKAILDTLPADAYFSDFTAATLHGLPVPLLAKGPSAPIHISVRSSQPRPRRSGVVAHRRNFVAADICRAYGVPLTTPQRTYVDLASQLDRYEAVVIGDAILRQKLASRGELLHHIRTSGRRWGLALARTLVPLLDGRAQSPPESILRLRLYDEGISVVSQCPIRNDHGRIIAHADLGNADLKIALEYEGRQHASGEQFTYDVRRYTDFGALGWLLLRAGRDDYREKFLGFVQRVHEAIAQRQRGG